MTSNTVDLVQRSLSDEAVEPYLERVRDQAAWLRERIEEGEMDNADFAVGLEMELYAVAGPPPGPVADESDRETSRADADEDPQGRLAPIPESVFEDPAANKELGHHNVEVNTEPDVLSGDGLAAQADAIERRTAAARAAARDAGLELVLDAMWTIPPNAGSKEYLSDVVVREGVTLASNMRQDPRYVAIDNEALAHAGGEIAFSVPGADHTFPSILFESLATSIQPHLHVPSAAAFPAYYNVAIRTLGPVLALATNSPFLPADLYAEDLDPDRLVEETHHELRIAAFEQSVNQTANPKVRVPRDLEDATDVVERVVTDDTYAPFLREWLDDDDRESLADRIWEFDYKRGSYWRWLRCVVGGDPVDGAGDEYSLRIEYRPIPTQPTVRDTVGMQALTAGLIRGLVAADHPLATLPWEAAEASFYSAVEEGLEADLAWVTAEGERTSDPSVIYAELFAHARRGLAEAGVSPADVETYLSPIEARWNAGLTPSAWKKARVREELEAGLDLGPAIEAMQREYIRRSLETDSFAAWL